MFMPPCRRPATPVPTETLSSLHLGAFKPCLIRLPDAVSL
jgi:hypothetical protein